MGVLDEAIREHLELKRQHGAPDDEVKRQEQEALGAVRREPAPDGAEDAAASEAAVPEAVAPEAGVVEPAPAEPVAQEPPPPQEPPPAAEQAPVPEPVAEPEPVTEQPTESMAPAAEPEPRPDEPADPGAEDVLEDTPDFLQETPEHDRLWFEQKPPRDFNFDE